MAAQAAEYERHHRYAQQRSQLCQVTACWAMTATASKQLHYLQQHLL